MTLARSSAPSVDYPITSEPQVQAEARANAPRTAPGGPLRALCFAAHPQDLTDLTAHQRALGGPPVRLRETGRPPSAVVSPSDYIPKSRAAFVPKIFRSSSSVSGSSRILAIIERRLPI